MVNKKQTAISLLSSDEESQPRAKKRATQPKKQSKASKVSGMPRAQHVPPCQGQWISTDQIHDLEVVRSSKETERGG